MIEQKGLSLVEIMISLLLSSLLTSLLIQHYLSIKQQYHKSLFVLEAEYELQLVSEVMRDSIRHAGFTPCLGISHLRVYDRRYAKLVPLTALSIKAGSRLAISRMSNQFSEVRLLDSRHLLVDSHPSLLSGAPFMIADCFHAEIHIASRHYQTEQGMILILEQPLFFDYSSPAYVGEWIEEQFFVAKDVLYYANRHAEELSGLIHKLIVQKAGRLVRVTLGLANNESISLDTLMRIP